MQGTAIGPRWIHNGSKHGTNISIWVHYGFMHGSTKLPRCSLGSFGTCAVPRSLWSCGTVSVCVAEWLRSPPLMRESLGSAPRAGKYDSGCHPSRSLKLAETIKQWVAAVEYCECKPQVCGRGGGDRSTRVFYIVENHFNYGLTAAIETVMSTALQI